MIGTFGDIIFEVNEQTLRTFDGFVKKSIGRWEVHNLLNANPRSEFLGRGQGEVEFTMNLSSEYGDVREEIEKIEDMAETGKHAPIIIGQRPVSNGDWYVENSETTWTWVNGRGELTMAEIILTVREY